MQLSKCYWHLICSCGLSIACIASQVWAQNPKESVPVPLPTNATAVRTRSFDITSSASINAQYGKGKVQADSAFQVARLNGLFDLCVQASPTFAHNSTVSIDDFHEPLLMLGWLAQTKIARRDSDRENVELKLTNTSWNLYEERPPVGKVVYRKDINGDGTPDEFIYGPDSCITIVSKGRVLGKTINIGSFYGRIVGAGEEGMRNVSYTEFLRIKDVKRLNSERINIVIDIRTIEILGERLVGSYSCERELPLDVAGDCEAPSVVIEIPHSERVDKLKNVEMKGVVEAPSGIAKANLLLNGKEVWNIPEGLNLDKLTLDLSLDLVPGVNEMLVNVWDEKSRNFKKSVPFLAPPSSKVARNHALLIGTDSASIQAVNSVREQLLRRKYLVKSLRGVEATTANISKAMDYICQNCKTGDRVFIYFVGDVDWDGSERVFMTRGASLKGEGQERPLRDSDWLNWQRELKPYRICCIFDTVATAELQKQGGGNVQDMRLLRGLQGLNNQILTSGNPNQQFGSSRKLNELLVETWKDFPKVDIFDLTPRVYEKMCKISSDVCPQFTMY